MKPKQFTKREEQILDMLIAGCKNEEISEKTGLSNKTVSTYYARARVKAGVKKKTNQYRAVVQMRSHRARLRNG